jgi:hypothetical protein
VFFALLLRDTNTNETSIVLYLLRPPQRRIVNRQRQPDLQLLLLMTTTSSCFSFRPFAPKPGGEVQSTNSSVGRSIARKGHGSRKPNSFTPPRYVTKHVTYLRQFEKSIVNQINKFEIAEASMVP